MQTVEQKRNDVKEKIARQQNLGFSTKSKHYKLVTMSNNPEERG